MQLYVFIYLSYLCLVHILATYINWFITVFKISIKNEEKHQFNFHRDKEIRMARPGGIASMEDRMVKVTATEFSALASSK